MTKEVKFFKKIKVIFVSLALAFLLPKTASAWFDPSGPDYGKVIITRANTYEAYPTNINVFADISLAAVAFFDYGDVDPAITWQYGGDPANTFYVAYPVTLYVWFRTNSVLINREYAEAKIQYFEGTDSGSSDAWTTIVTITNFPPSMFNHQGSHFGFLTWTPPKTNNVEYLIRVWAKLSNGMENASTNSLNIDKDGNGSDWYDYDVLLIKSMPVQKPGTRALTYENQVKSQAKFEFINDNGKGEQIVASNPSVETLSFIQRIKNFFNNILQNIQKFFKWRTK